MEVPNSSASHKITQTCDSTLCKATIQCTYTYIFKQENLVYG